MTDSEIAIAAMSPALLPVPPDPLRNPYWTYLAQLNSPESRQTMSGCLDRVAAIVIPPSPGEQCPNYGQYLPWHVLRREHVIMIRTAIATERNWSPNHANKHLSAIRGVLRECWLLGLMDAEAYQRALTVKRVSGTRVAAGRSIPASETRAILAACLTAPGPLGVRDAAIIASLHSTGGRRAEVANMLIEKYERSDRSVGLVGKGDKERTAWLHPTAVPYVDNWLAIVNQRAGPMFRPVDRWGNVGNRALSPRSIGHVVDRRRIEAGLPKLTTHDWRRTFVGDLLDAGVDLVIVQEIVGHADPATTSKYDRRPGRKRRAAVDKLSLPSPGQLSPADTTSRPVPEDAT
jgi:site-specific recombinase XerD